MRRVSFLSILSMPTCILILSMLPAVFALSGCNRSQTKAEAESTQDETAVVQVVQPARTQIVRTTTQPATIAAFHEAELHARVAGYVSELQADIGQKVSQGQVLARISVPEMDTSMEKQEATIRKLQADERRARASVSLASAEVLSAEAAAAQAAADVGSAVAALTAAGSEFRRVSELVESQSVAAQLLDESREKYESAEAVKTSSEAARESATAAVAVAREKKTVAEAELATAQAETEVARKALKEMEVMANYASLLAPFDGIVTQRHIDPGDLAPKTDSSSAASRKALFAVAQVDRMRVRIMLPENDAALASVGDPVTLRVRSFPGEPFEGHISRMAGRLDESTRTMLVEVDLPNPDRRLIPGMYAEATVRLHEKPDALSLSASAVRYDEAGNSRVYVVGEGSRIRVVDVTTGYDDGRQIEILSGLKESDRVVGAAPGRLEDGQKVRVQ